MRFVPPTTPLDTAIAQLTTIYWVRQVDHTGQPPMVEIHIPQSTGLFIPLAQYMAMSAEARDAFVADHVRTIMEKKRYADPKAMATWATESTASLLYVGTATTSITFHGGG